jgi:predicted short-subunit dehydrogenase-like oxidoreductase (DUF2520 family)
MNVVVLGRGKVGKALARAWRKSSLRVRLTSGHDPDLRAVGHADAVVCAVPDGAIAACAERLAPRITPAQVVLHCAGARTELELEACRRRGVPAAALHPLVSFASARKPPAMRGTTFVVAGDPAAVRAGRQLARAAGARAVTARVHGGAYHAAAALVANGAAALATHAVRVLERLGTNRRDAERALGGLLVTVGHNVMELGLPGALTGPVARGDADTVRAHRRELARVDRRSSAVYDAVAPAVLEAAVEAGLPRARARAIRHTLLTSNKG